MNPPYIGFIKSAYTLLFLMKKQANGFEKIACMTVKNSWRQEIA
jgi:hypothetical protein